MKWNWTKRLSLMAIACSLVLTACSKSDSSGTKASDGPNASAGATSAALAKKAPLSIMWWGPDPRHQATLKALDLYTKNFPNVTFTSDYMAFDQYWIKLPTLAASKTVPDVLQMDGAYIQEYAKKGVLMDLSDIDLTGLVDPKIVNNVKVDGKLYGIPLAHNGAGIAFNKTELTAAGITLPHKDWTWDEFIAYMKEARAKLPKEKYPFTDGSAVWDWYQFYQTSYGKGPMMIDGKKFNLDKDLWFKFNKMYEQWRADGTIPPADKSAAYKENDPKLDAMAQGVMARGVTVGSVSVMETMNPGKIAVVNNPVGPSGGGWAQATIFLSISANTKFAAESKKFVKWFIADKEVGTVLGMTRGVPINNEIFKQLEPTLEAKDILGKSLLDAAIDKALPFYPAPAGWSEFPTTYKAEMEAVSFKKETLEQAYEKIVAKGKEIEAKLSK
jgi:multiple sugar transport system substrate-binding protein